MWPLKVSCLGVEEQSDDPCCLVLTSRGNDRSLIRFIMQTSSPEVRQAWLGDVVQILETQRNFLNGTRVECFLSEAADVSVNDEWHLNLWVAALQSPIEYQRREGKSSSLGRNMKPPTPSSSGLQPRTSASMDRRHQPSLLSSNTSLPSLHPGKHSPAAKAVSEQWRWLMKLINTRHLSIWSIIVCDWQLTHPIESNRKMYSCRTVTIITIISPKKLQSLTKWLNCLVVLERTGNFSPS